jgi:hypothetical protein
MTRAEASAALRRALQISRELTAAADSGDVPATLRLDAERRVLLQSAHAALQPMEENDRWALREIAELNDRALGLVEHHRRGKQRAMDTVAVGRRAVVAYSSTSRMHR